ncbi:probable linoleate 9S-lipoxygenase 5 isoform X2 [Dendrobium catenatum]|uniref:probable linoleate 9S-lipoxygenase 5 isoform X1 n=1 Tax=Dendrobium catenatum TaxID=906689 RepID=UPI0009F27976|nr:probable linoleate 9S-lipoxygenase 5 isoform X1 [Dendrobium catenatum]XP_028550439.1 probable linoleate 9S-lipoxygenase 5 isoform X2 [Dendrobium catenatum]
MSSLHKLVDAIAGKHENSKKKKKANTSMEILGTVVLMKKNVLDFNDFNASLLDNLSEFVGERVSFQLVSATSGDHNRGNRGKVGEEAYLEDWGKAARAPVLAAGESLLSVRFMWEESFGEPGAVIVKNRHRSEFFLKSLSLEGGGLKNRVQFDCNSWVYPVERYNYDRVFFANESYLPSKTPETLVQYREEELHNLRGDNVEGMLKEHDRVYGYAFYDDLGDPDRSPDLARPVLGGSKGYPYPRRGRTSRPSSKSDPNTESRLPLLSLDIYVPRDERFGHLKMSDFLAYALKSVVQVLVPTLSSLFDHTPTQFETFQDVLNLYEGGLRLPDCPALDHLKNNIPFEMIKELVRTDGEHVLKLPLPQVIKYDKLAWRTDEEFAREMLAGVNPVIISRLQAFPPSSQLDPVTYGNHQSSITASHIEKNLDGLTVQQALKRNKLFILDHHDALMPYLNRINKNTPNKVYATRTLLFLQEDSTLKPLAIELSLPHPDGEELGAVSRVFTPPEDDNDGGVKESIWQLAKAYATVNDSGVHQLISHWLNTHAAIEPFVIATHRQLSVMHPIHKLLSPHYRDTMNINALARQILINAGGILEATVFPGKYAMEMSSAVYQNWNFTEQGLPADLLKRGVAVEDPTSPHNLRLLIQDYPYAVDGLAIWSAIESWVTEYSSIYYTSDDEVSTDKELQAWWKELREIGHGDKKDEPWWPKLSTVVELIRTCTTVIWIASALHAAVNFGQYPYAGYSPNRPTISRRLMPELGSPEYETLRENPDLLFLRTITGQFQSILGVSLIEILSRHSSDEVYLGQRDSSVWTKEEAALEAFNRFGKRLVEIERSIVKRNEDEKLKNRNGKVEIPYTLLYPNTSDFSRVGGLTGKGIPNSVSI